MDRQEFATQLKRWQARSCHELSSKKPEDLFETSFAARYSRLHRNLWRRVIRVHGTLHTLEQIKEFPLDDLYAPGDMEFWRLVIENSLDSAVLLLHGLVNDSGVEVHSLRSFQTEIMKAPWLDGDERDLLKQELRELKFDGFAKSIASQVEVIRHNCVAHTLIDVEKGHVKAATPVSLNELRQLFDATHALFGGLSFGSTFVTLAGDLMPGTVGGRVKRTCLDGVFDAILRCNDFVNRPERESLWWKSLREHMPLTQLRLMNDLRGRIGLPEA